LYIFYTDLLTYLLTYLLTEYLYRYQYRDISSISYLYCIEIEKSAIEASLPLLLVFGVTHGICAKLVRNYSITLQVLQCPSIVQEMRLGHWDIALPTVWHSYTGKLTLRSS